MKAFLLVTILASGGALAADSSCSAKSDDKGDLGVCSITCDSPKQAVCEEGVGGRPPECKCVHDGSGESGERDGNEEM